MLLEQSEALLRLSSRITQVVDRLSEEEDRALRQILTLVTLVDLGIFLIGALKILILVRPLNTLSNSVQALGRGSFGQRVAVPQTDDEIRDLAIAFNQLACSLQETVVSKAYLGELIDTIGEQLYVIDDKDRIKTINSLVLSSLNYSHSELVGQHFSNVFSTNDRESVLEKLALVRLMSGRMRVEACLIKRDGAPLSVFCTLAKMNGHSSGAQDVICVATDITERKRYEEELRKLHMAVEQSISSIVITDTQGNIEFVNRQFTHYTGYSLGDVKGQNIRILKSGKHDASFYNELWDTIRSGREFRSEICNRKKDGTLYWELLSISPILDGDNKITHYIAVQIDDTERKRAEEKLKQLAHFDSLTQIPNRVLFGELLRETLHQARLSGHHFALLFLDLDGFKYINDTLGHHVGDELLKVVASRLASCVRQSDVISRLGGDEFQVLLTRISQPDDAALVARKIIASINEPCVLGTHLCRVGVSIGISTYPEDGQTMDALTKNADMAMYRVKEFGKNDFMFYSREISAVLVERLSLEQALRQAVELGAFALHYQPKVEISTGKIVGCEALIRWTHPELGLVSPGRFIPLAEELNLITPIGMWALVAACAQNVVWQSVAPLHRISVNLSPLQFHSPGLVDQIRTVLTETGLDASLLDLEITEGGIMRNVEEGIRLMKHLIGEGVSFSIDDFGTGHSSLLYLKRFPVGTLKIDQNFIRDCVHDPRDAVIISSIISMSRSLGLRVVAEGVETTEQLALLSALGCDEAQGFIFARPLPASEYDQLLRNGQPLCVKE